MMFLMQHLFLIGIDPFRVTEPPISPTCFHSDCSGVVGELAVPHPGDSFSSRYSKLSLGLFYFLGISQGEILSEIFQLKIKREGLV